MKKFILFFLLASTLTITQAQKTVTIGILADEPANNTQLLSQLKSEIKTIVGQQTTVVFGEVLANNFDSVTAKANYQKLLANETDIILTFGVVDVIVLHQETNYPKPVIVFGTINSDFVKLPEEQNTSGINNMTYIITPSSYAKDLDAFSKLYDYKKIGILVDDYLPKILPLNTVFDSYFSNKESTYKIIPINKSTQFNTILNDVDAVYLTGGFNFADTSFNKMVAAINQNKLPSFSAVRKADVERGILASNQPETNINQFFRRIALNVEAIISGKKPFRITAYAIL